SISVATLNFNSEDSDQIDISTLSLETGSYKLTMETEDRYGEKVKVEKIVEFFANDKRAFTDEGLKLAADKPNYQPGETARIYIGTAFKDASVWIVESRNDAVKRYWKKVDQFGYIDLNIEEKDRGNRYVQAYMIKHNNSFHQNKTIFIPWSNKELSIEFETFRDKLLPGQEEEWRLKISGPKGSKVAAELLATMYDASLDAFAKNNWNLNLFPTNRIGYNYMGSDFNQRYSRRFGRGQDMQHTEIPNRIYPVLNWFGFPMWGTYYGGYRDEVMVQSGNVRTKMRRSSAPVMRNEANMPAPEAEFAEDSDGASINGAINLDDNNVEDANVDLDSG
ncbi:MAG: hypothetical protein AAGK97_17935, partial [Bacteroidota bacterium]